MTKNETLAVLAAYRAAIDVACPGLHAEMAEESRVWWKASKTELGHELERYLLHASVLSCNVRLFFKMGDGLAYGGCNRQFAMDAGLRAAHEIVGLDDFDPRIAWVAQAAKYRKDDRDVMERSQPKLGIIERQTSASGLLWLDTSKVPIVETDQCIGVFGTYEIIDAKTASRRSLARQR